MAVGSAFVFLSGSLAVGTTRVGLSGRVLARSVVLAWTRETCSQTLGVADGRHDSQCEHPRDDESDHWLEVYIFFCKVKSGCQVDGVQYSAISRVLGAAVRVHSREGGSLLVARLS